MYQVLSDPIKKKIIFDEYELNFADFPKPDEPFDRYDMEEKATALVKEWNPNLRVEIFELDDNGNPLEVLLIYEYGG